MGEKLPPLRAGRQPAGRALLAWRDDDRAPRLCLLTGSSGSGRSHLLSWMSEARPEGQAGGVDAVIPAAGLSLRAAVWQLSRRLGHPAHYTIDLCQALADSGTPLTIVVTDLDRAYVPELLAAGLLIPLLSVPGVRLLVEVVEGGPAAEALRADFPGPAVLNLDDPQWTDAERFAAWCARLDPSLDPRSVYPHPTSALLAARTPVHSRHRGPDIAGHAASWWQAVPDDVRPAIHALSRTERALSQAQWALLPGAPTADTVARAAALLPPLPGGDTWRLGPGAVRALVAETAPESDPAETVQHLTARVPRLADGAMDPGECDPALLSLLLEAASKPSAPGELLDDPAFLVHADPVEVTVALQRGGQQTPVAKAWEVAGPALLTLTGAEQRADLLGLYLTGRDHEARARLSGLAGRAWYPLWARWASLRDRPPYQLTLGRGPHQGELLGCITAEANLVVLCAVDPSTGEERLGDRLALPAEPASLTSTIAGHTISVDGRGVVRVLPQVPWTPSDHGTRAVRTAEWIGEHLREKLTTLAVPAVDYSSGLVFAGDTEGHVYLYRIDTQVQPATPDGPVHTGKVTALDAAVVKGHPIAVSGGADGRVRLWLPSVARPCDLLEAREHPVTAVAVEATPLGLTVVTTWADGFVRIRRQGTPETVAEFLLPDSAMCATVDPEGRVYISNGDGYFAIALS